MEIELLICGYSFHKSKFYTQEKNGLKHYLFRLQTEGNASALIEGKLQPIEAGDLLLFQPGDPYELLIDTNSHVEKYPITSGDYFLKCQGTWIDQWWNQSTKQTLTKILIDEHLLSLWRQISIEKHRVKKQSDELISYLMRALCIYLERVSLEAIALQGHNYTALQMKSYIEKNALNALKIEDIAKSVGLSVSRAVHLYKECFGVSMIQYAIEIRLSVAAERMHYTSYNLEQIAASCGFYSYPHFHRSFKQKYGISPKSYRAKTNKLLLNPFV
jgi:AraC family transcriptional regulator of arabinose operon